MNAGTGDWRVSGQFASPQALAGEVSAAWAFAAGRVSNGVFVRGSADTSIGGATVQLGAVHDANSGGNLTYSLTGSSNGSVSGTTVGLGTTGGGALNVLHSAIELGCSTSPASPPSVAVRPTNASPSA